MTATAADRARNLVADLRQAESPAPMVPFACAAEAGWPAAIRRALAAEMELAQTRAWARRIAAGFRFANPSTWRQYPGHERILAAFREEATRFLEQTREAHMAWIQESGGHLPEAADPDLAGQVEVSILWSRVAEAEGGCPTSEAQS